MAKGKRWRSDDDDDLRFDGSGGRQNERRYRREAWEDDDLSLEEQRGKVVGSEWSDEA